jgi:AraC-like DNA-binding protein
MEEMGALSAAGERLAFLPPAALAGVVRYFHVERASPGPVLVPSTPSVMLTFFVSGSSLAGDTRFDRAMLCGPLTRPFQALWQADTTFVSALIEPEYLPLLFDVDASELSDTPVPLADLPSAPDCAALEALLPTLSSPRRWAAALAEWMLALLDRREGRRDTFILPRTMLAMSTDDIATRFGMSVRQLERRHLASYGLTLRDSRKMERYVRALSALLLLPPRRGVLTRIAVDAGYHDQAHMVRDFTHYTGMAPGALLKGAQEDEELRLYRYGDPYREIVARPR